MPLLEALELVVKPWARFYSKSTPTQSVVMFTHIAGMLGGGGLAIAADRAMWKARTATDDVRRQLLADVGKIHGPVIAGLAMSVVSGALMTASDLETFVTSPVWWVKMGLVALLLANGAWLRSVERGVQAAPSTMPLAWKRLSISSRTSYTLWFAVALFGVLLTNI